MPRRPNILFILTDQHARRIAGFAGDDVVQTQALDRLASRSVQFDGACCASPCCTPSRMTMLTGKDVHHCSAWANHWVIFPEHITWPGYFAQHGYRTALVGKMHFGGRDQMQGFQLRPYGDLRHGLGHQPDPIHLFPSYAGAQGAGVTEIPESLLQDVVVTRETLSLLREHADAERETPWFCCASYSRPHSPFTTPGRYIRRYRDKVPSVELPDDFLERMDPYSRKMWELESGSRAMTAEQMVRAREAYYACVDFVDDCIGELLDGLEADGLLENTIVIYTSDHGEMAGELGMWGKTVPYEPSIGVPLLLTGPQIREGCHRVDHPISLMDLFPTTCTLAGLPVPDGLDGVDQTSVLTDPDQGPPPREYAPSTYIAYGVRPSAGVPLPEYESAGAMRVWRGRAWKYVAIEGEAPLLFDMINDPAESTNLANSADLAETLQTLERGAMEEFSWGQVHTQLARDRERVNEFSSGRKPTTPNQYMLTDGRVFDAESALYEARWLYLPPSPGGGMIPQRFG